MTKKKKKKKGRKGRGEEKKFCDSILPLKTQILLTGRKGMVSRSLAIGEHKGNVAVSRGRHKTRG